MHICFIKLSHHWFRRWYFLCHLLLWTNSSGEITINMLNITVRENTFRYIVCTMHTIWLRPQCVCMSPMADTRRWWLRAAMFVITLLFYGVSKLNLCQFSTIIFKCHEPSRWTEWLNLWLIGINMRFHWQKGNHKIVPAPTRAVSWLYRGS